METSSSAPASSLDCLSDDLLLAIFLPLDIEDLLHASRVNRRLHALVSNGAEAVWKHLHERTFGPPDKWSKNIYWKERYRDRHFREQRRLKMAREVKKMRALSYVLDLEAQLRITRQAFRDCFKTCREAKREEIELERSREAQVALGVWQPQAVRSQQQQLVAQVPLEACWRIRGLQQSRADMEVHMRSLRESLRVIERKLRIEKQRSHALQGA